MSMSTSVAERDWSAPATRGDLVMLQADLEGKIKDVRVEMANMGRALESRIDNLRVDLGGEIAKLRVSMAWMTVAVVTVLGGLTTLFEFLP